ncbi:hypothetical protein ABK040_015503 [Willaertia magna]
MSYNLILLVLLLVLLLSSFVELAKIAIHDPLLLDKSAKYNQVALVSPGYGTKWSLNSDATIDLYILFNPKYKEINYAVFLERGVEQHVFLGEICVKNIGSEIAQIFELTPFKAQKLLQQRGVSTINEALFQTNKTIINSNEDKISLESRIINRMLISLSLPKSLPFGLYDPGDINKEDSHSVATNYFKLLFIDKNNMGPDTTFYSASFQIVEPPRPIIFSIIGVVSLVLLPMTLCCAFMSCCCIVIKKYNLCDDEECFGEDSEDDENEQVSSSSFKVSQATNRLQKLKRVNKVIDEEIEPTINSLENEVNSFTKKKRNYLHNKMEEEIYDNL